MLLKMPTISRAWLLLLLLAASLLHYYTLCYYESFYNFILLHFWVGNFNLHSAHASARKREKEFKLENAHMQFVWLAARLKLLNKFAFVGGRGIKCWYDTVHCCQLLLATIVCFTISQKYLAFYAKCLPGHCKSARLKTAGIGHYSCTPTHAHIQNVLL